MGSDKMAFVWNVADPGKAVTFALSYRESLAIATEMAT